MAHLGALGSNARAPVLTKSYCIALGKQHEATNLRSHKNFKSHILLAKASLMDMEVMRSLP